MMRHLFFVSLLWAALSFSCFGQTNSTSNSSSTAASPQNSGDLEPLPPQTKGDFWDGDDPNFLNLVTHPFANKKYVQRMTRPIKDRLEELDSITTENSSRIKDVDARAQHGLQLASEKTTLADNHATDATNRAQQAQSAATDASSQVSMAEKMVGSLDQYKSGSQTEIRFRAGQTMLSKQAKDALDDMAAGLKDQRSYIVEVQGFASGRGQAAIASSQKMADSVVRYLVLSHQIPVYRMYVLSMGNAPAQAASTAAKHVSGGRVEVSVMKNDLATAQR
jgi:outer membrane protein OmpA-like peptidoglycan-associated protein